jgi:hypothetical protein
VDITTKEKDVADLTYKTLIQEQKTRIAGLQNELGTIIGSGDRKLIAEALETAVKTLSTLEVLHEGRP